MSHSAIKSIALSSDPPAVLSPNFIRLLVVQASFGVSFSAFLLLPKFLKMELTASATEIGWVMGIALVGAALVSPLIGFVARLFDRRALLALSLVLQGGSSLAFVYVTEVGLLAYGLRVAQGLAFVLVFNCTTTIAADILPEKSLARGVGYLGVAMMLTNALAPLAVEPLVDAYGWSVAFIGSGALALAALGILPLLQDPKVELSAASTKTGADESQLGPIYYASFLMGAGLGAMFTFVQPFAIEQGAERVGQFFLGYVATAVGVRILLGGLTDRVGPSKVAVAGLAVYAIVLTATAKLNVDLLLPLGAGLGIAHGFLFPAINATGLFMVSAARRTIFMGWFTCAFNAGFAMTVLLLGPVADRFGYPLLFSIVGVLIATGVPSLVKVHKQVRRAGARDS